MTLTTNDTGYYEANLLIAGDYRIDVEKPGFRKIVRSGIVLPISARVEIDFALEVGEASETALRDGGRSARGHQPRRIGRPGDGHARSARPAYVQ